MWLDIIKLVQLLLFACLIISSSAGDPPPEHDDITSQIRLISKFNRAMCTAESLEATPLQLFYKSRISRFPVNKPETVSRYNLKKYEYRDTDYVEKNLSEADEKILRNSQTPPDIFQQSKVFIQNYMILSEQEFKIVVINPSDSFRFCITNIFIDIPEIELSDSRKTPYCLSPHTKYPLRFKIYVQDARWNGQLHSNLFLNVEIYDNKSIKFVENRVWTKEILINVQNNWLGVQKLQFQEETLIEFVLENRYMTEIKIQIKSDLKLSFNSMVQIDRGNMLLKIQPENAVIIMVEAKEGHIIINGSLIGQKFGSVLKIPVVKTSKVTIDNTNIGILTNKKQTVQTLLTVTNSNNFPIFIDEVEVFSKLKTVELVPFSEATSRVGPLTGLSPVAKIRVYSSIKDQITSKCLVRVKFHTESKKPKQIEQYFHYAQIHNPLTGMQKRFISYNQSRKRREDVLLQAKNSINIPLQMTRLIIIDTTKFKVTPQNQNTPHYIYPNQNSHLFELEHLGFASQPQLPVVNELMLLEFNHNIHIPVQIILYDKKLECSFDSQVVRCSKLNLIDLGNVRPNVLTTREFRIKNSNPLSMPINISMNPIGSDIKVTYVSQHTLFDFDEKTIRTEMRARTNFTIRFTIKSQSPKSQPEIRFKTSEEEFKIRFVYKVSEGKLSVFPNPLTITDVFDLSNLNYLYMQSTLPEPYSIIRVTSNDTEVITAFDSAVPVQIQEVKALPILFYSSTVKPELWNEHLLTTLQYVSKEPDSLLKVIKMTIKTNNDFELSAKIRLVKQKNTLIEQSYVFYPVIENTHNNIYSINITNPYKVPILVHPILVDSKIIENSLESKALFDSLLQKGPFYICVTDSVKAKHKQIAQKFKSVFHLENSLTEFEIDTLENSSFYLNWMRKEVQLKQHKELSSEMSQEMVNLVLGGARYCYKGQAPFYFQQLTINNIFNILLEQDIITEFVERQYEHLMRPKFTKFYDPFYDKILSQFPNELRKMQQGTNLCFFKFCQYLPLRMPENSRVLNPNESFLATISLVHTNVSVKTSFVVLNNMTSPQHCLLEFNVTKMLLKVEGLVFYNNQFSKQEFFNEYLSELKIDSVRSLPVYITTQDLKEGFLIGQRMFILKNYGSVMITVQNIVFQDTMSCEHPYYRILHCQPFIIHPKQSYNLTVDFKLNPKRMSRSVPIILYSQKYFYRLNLINVVGQSNENMNLPASESQLCVYLLITIASVWYIYRVLKLVQEEDPKEAKVRTIIDRAVHFPIEKTERPKQNRLPTEYITRLNQERQRNVRSTTTSMEGSKKMHDSESNELEVSQPSISLKDQVSSVQMRSNQISAAQDNHSDESASKMSSGSSLSQGFLDRLNEIANGKYDNSNSDANEQLSQASSSNQQFYDAFKSEGPLRRKRFSEDIQEKMDDQSEWLQEIVENSIKNKHVFKYDDQ